MSVWLAHVEREQGRYSDAMSRSSVGDGAGGAQLVRAANAAWGAGLSLLMEGNPEEASQWFAKAADAYRRSYEGAPKDSWGRPIGAIKSRLLAGDSAGAGDDARWTLSLGAGEASSPIGRYAATLALLVLGDEDAAARVARGLRDEPADEFPGAVADALFGLAQRDIALYRDGVEVTLRSFELRDRHLEDVPVADTVLVLEALAEARSMACSPGSPLLPSADGS
jgi:hypothetical protein